jgi:putative selenium metabolism protein SsnA
LVYPREGVLSSGPTLLIRGGHVALLDDDFTVLSDGAVAIVGNRIEAVGGAADVSARYEGAEIIDASGKLVMPGLINAHTHLYSALARGLVADIEPSSNFTEILEHLWWRLDRALTLDDVRLSAAAGAIDLVRNGTTTIINHHASQVDIDGSLSAVAEPLDESGLRFNLCFEISDRNGEEAREAGLAENERFARLAASRQATSRRGSSGGRDSSVGPGGDEKRVGASVGLHASFTLDDATLERAAGMACDLGVGCHVHAAEDVADVEDSIRRSGKRVVERLESFGVLGTRSIAAHSIHVDARETAMLAESGTIVVHNPQSNMNNAVGCADVPGMLDSGVLMGLGTDGFTASMFDEMKVANLIHRHQSGDPRIGHDVAARLCLHNNQTVASRLFDDRIGRLEPGALADVIVLDYDPPTSLETGNFGGHLIFGLTGWMVETVVIGGRVVMRDRELTTVDAGEISARARERARDLWKRM